MALTTSNKQIRDFLKSILEDDRLYKEDKIDKIAMFINELKGNYKLQDDFQNTREKYGMNKLKLNDDIEGCCYYFCYVPRVICNVSKVFMWMMLLFLCLVVSLYIFFKIVTFFK
jgi:hypothetical protein